MAGNAFDTGAFNLDAFETGFVEDDVQGVYSVTGKAAALAKGYAVFGASGSYSLTGKAAATTRTRIFSAAQGSYTYTGNADVLAEGRKLFDTKGVYSLTGNANALAYDRIFHTAQGAYSLTGNANVGGLGMTLGTGAYPLAGNIVAFGYHYHVDGSPGSYPLTGNANDLQVSGHPILNPNTGLYTITGQNVRFFVLKQVSGASGVYSLNGGAVQFFRGISLPLAAATFPYAGFAASSQRAMTLGSGVYVQNKFDSARIVTHIPPQSGAYTFTGNSANFNIGFTPPTGLYTQTRSPVGLVHSAKVFPATGVYPFTGDLSGTTVARKLFAVSGSFSLAGKASTFHRALAVTQNANGAYPYNGFDDLLMVGRPALRPDRGVYTFTGSSVALFRVDPFSLDESTDGYIVIPEDPYIQVAA